MTINLILHNAVVYTVDPQNPLAEAVACANGYIVAVGRNHEILALANAETEIIDAQGQFVLPGFTDAHVHFLQYAVRRHQVNLLGVRDLAEVRHLIQQAVERAAPQEWVQGWGWDENLWDRQPDAAFLDEFSPDTPVVLARMDMHTWWLNSAAMRQANITAETVDPPDSRLERDAAGQPTGLFREWNAIRLIEPYLPQPNNATLQKWLLEAMHEAHQLGLTAIHDQRVEREGAQSWHLWQQLRREGQLNLRVHANIAADYLTEAITLGLQSGWGDERLWLGHVKTFADGTLGSRTALMLEPFESEADNLGMVITSVERLTELAHQAEAAGLALSVHAIGDKAVRQVIDVLAGVNRPNAKRPLLPHRIEHVQTIHPDDLPRLAAHGLFASMQPVHLLTDWAVADQFWGAKRARYSYAFRSLLHHNTVLAFGSDAPVAPLNPMLGLYAAIARQDERGLPVGGWYPEERLTVAEAIYGYTMGPAILAGKEPWQGSITPGKWADLIILSHDLFQLAPQEIPQVKVKLTVFAGQVVFR